MVDRGASHNFISHKLVSLLGLPTQSFVALIITFGDGHRIWVQERCKQIEVKLGEFFYALSALVFELGNLDMVLGIEWLKTLGEVIQNWKEQSMRFKQWGRWVELKASSAMQVQQVPLQVWLATQKVGVMGKKFDNGAMCIARNLCHNLNSAQQQQQLRDMLKKYSEVFSEPQGLPPNWSHDHAINLLPNQGLVCVRPYRYPYIQKEEIEQQVRDMLTKGIIRPSKSVYSSPVILVKKKDQSWRMCVDYKPLTRSQFQTSSLSL